MYDSFVQTIFWNHFGCNIIGYLYALSRGALVIWDFDDDNMLKFWIPASAPSIDAAIPSVGSEVAALELRHHALPMYNPYPVFGAPSLPSWPQGILLDYIKDPACTSTTLKQVEVSSKSFGVLQSLADYQPDVDAIYRIMMPIPFWFDRSKKTKPLKSFQRESWRLTMLKLRYISSQHSLLSSCPSQLMAVCQTYVVLGSRPTLWIHAMPTSGSRL